MSGDPSIDLNADAGEGYDSAELFAAISSANIACGGHAGDDASMRAAVALARAHGVALGAHPGYEDRERFGRVETGASARDIAALVRRQLERLAGIAAAAEVPLAHLKPHGALYHRATEDPEAARAIVEATAAWDPGLALVGWPGGALLAAAAAAGLAAIPEGFVDRRYDAGGRLAARSRADALLDEGEAVAQALALAGAGGAVRSLCLHSDAPGAAALARATRRALEAAGFAVGSCAAPARVRALPELHVVGAAIVEGGRVLLTRRAPGMSMPGKWEFPGGKVEAGESAVVALAREIREELGLEVAVGARIGRGTALHDGRRIVLEVFRATRTGGRLRLAEHEETGWYGAGELGALDWPEADLPVLPALARVLRERQAAGD